MANEKYPCASYALRWLQFKLNEPKNCILRNLSLHLCGYLSLEIQNVDACKLFIE